MAAPASPYSFFFFLFPQLESSKSEIAHMKLCIMPKANALPLLSFLSAHDVFQKFSAIDMHSIYTSNSCRGGKLNLMHVLNSSAYSIINAAYPYFPQLHLINVLYYGCTNNEQ
jgi:hypothetical protein